MARTAAEPLDAALLERARYTQTRGESFELKLERLLEPTLEGGSLEIPVEDWPHSAKRLRSIVARMARARGCGSSVITDGPYFRLWFFQNQASPEAVERQDAPGVEGLAPGASED
jgi:hypothetical protein